MNSCLQLAVVKVQKHPKLLQPSFSPWIFVFLGIDFEDPQIQKSGSIRKDPMPEIGRLEGIVGLAAFSSTPFPPCFKSLLPQGS